jgi:hypothetical protein
MNQGHLGTEVDTGVPETMVSGVLVNFGLQLLNFGLLDYYDVPYSAHRGVFKTFDVSIAKETVNRFSHRIISRNSDRACGLRRS